jgi:hypothetical protein
MRKVVILSWGAVLASCATVGKTNSLKVGMSKADVVSADFGKVAGFRGGQCPRTEMEKPGKK